MKNLKLKQTEQKLTVNQLEVGKTYLFTLCSFQNDEPYIIEDIFKIISKNKKGFEAYDEICGVSQTFEVYDEIFGVTQTRTFIDYINPTGYSIIEEII